MSLTWKEARSTWGALDHKTIDARALCPVFLLAHSPEVVFREALWSFNDASSSPVLPLGCRLCAKMCQWFWTENLCTQLALPRVPRPA